MNRLATTTGYSLFELIIVVVIIGILATITMRSLRGANDAIRIEETRDELDRLAFAITGNPDLTAGGVRSDFGYIGDIGALPPNLDALVVNPGYATWDGPYIADDYYASSAGASTEFKYDSWGNAYSYTGDVTITAPADGTPFTRRLANSMTDLLYNRVTLTVTDLDVSPPGPIYCDSVAAVLYVPDGTGTLATEVRYPAPDGSIRFDSIPIGLHRLQLAYMPTADTLTRRIAVNPGATAHIDLQYPEDVW